MAHVDCDATRRPRGGSDAAGEICPQHSLLRRRTDCTTLQHGVKHVSDYALKWAYGGLIAVASKVGNKVRKEALGAGNGTVTGCVH